VIKLTETLAVELRSSGVALFALHPGIVRLGMTDMVLDAVAGPDSPAGKVAAWLRDELAAGRDVPLEDVTRLVVQLARGQGDALSGRYIDAHDDLEALLARTDEIQEADRYTLRLR
jgi:3-oxoacyl-[acyl-carrier protein] reductase